jgi:MbtH protein
MTDPFENEKGEYKILLNGEGQHSLWPSFRGIPPGWSETGPKGTREECLDWIDANWTDMRPKSLATAMDNRPNPDPNSGG